MRNISSYHSSAYGCKDIASPLLLLALAFCALNTILSLAMGLQPHIIVLGTNLLILLAMGSVYWLSAKRLSAQALSQINDRNRMEKEASIAKQRMLDLSEQLDNLNAEMPNIQRMALIGQLSTSVAQELNNPIVFLSSNLSTLKEYVFFLDRLTKQLVELMASLSKAEKLKHESLIKEIERTLKIEDLDFVLNDAEGLLGESAQSLYRVKELMGSLNVFLHSDSQSRPANPNDLIEQAINLAWGRIKYFQIDKDLHTLPTLNISSGPFCQMVLHLILNAADGLDSSSGSLRITSFAKHDHLEIRIVSQRPKEHPKEAAKPKADNQKKRDTIGDLSCLLKGLDRQTLAFCYEVASLHKAQLDLDTKDGQSTAILRIPFETQLAESYV